MYRKAGQVQQSDKSHPNPETKHRQERQGQLPYAMGLGRGDYIHLPQKVYYTNGLERYLAYSATGYPRNLYFAACAMVQQISPTFQPFWGGRDMYAM